MRARVQVALIGGGEREQDWLALATSAWAGLCMILLAENPAMAAIYPVNSVINGYAPYKFPLVHEQPYWDAFSYLGRDGVRVYAKANIDDLVPAQEPAGESTIAETEARASVESLVADEAQKRGIAPPKVTWDSSADGLLVTVEVLVPGSGGGELGGFVDVVNGRMASLDQEGAGISQMTMRVVDATGKQVALELQDYDLAFGWRSLWMAPEMTKAGDRPEFAPVR